ncbi:hypothetical protein TL16_g12318 [Triparma laevis f. inornata]|uniref:Nudix hydrolase domain-containing protein n=2 Tax=Triparma laevis TaxID=1534972 RepID=A0A9W7A5D4_9STRA|nr:hypothetical protein TrLO_g3994 [Triparma laevis f. longispina]GMH92339.1 hypothetical protein TL16_g12318 [Triparma laevis f. inornata]
MASTDESSVQVVGTTRWLRLETITYKTEDGKEGKWDRAVRTTKSRNPEIPDAVCIKTVLKTDEGDMIVLVRQFRPPIGKYTIEIPAGLIDEGESIAEAALRELREECGYVGGVVTSVSPPLAMSPGLTDENVALVDVDLPKQPADAKQDLEGDEKGRGLEVVLVKKDEFKEELARLAEAGNCIMYGVWSMAL